jgi:hypothetical protein
LKKVKEYLDKYFEPLDISTIGEKDNGHYCVHGSWVFERGDTTAKYDENGSKDFTKISVNINNETIMFKLQMVNGENVGKYSYLQTYKHIPRGEPDINGYYKRSTDDEIIQYIDNMIKSISREEKIEELLK